MHNHFKMNALSILSLAAVWEIAGRMADSMLIPPLTQIAAAWYKLLLGGKLLPNLGASLWTMVVGFVLAVLVGIVIGLLMGRFRAVEHFLDLYVNALMSAPTTAFVPVLILWFGLGVQSRIAVVFLFAVFVVIINTMTGVKQVDRVLLEMARSFGAVDAQTRQLLQEELLELWQRERKTVIFITHSMDEAVYLSDRVVVMTPRPGQVAEVLDVPLARPRSAEAVRREPKFVELTNYIWDSLKKAMENGHASA